MVETWFMVAIMLGVHADGTRDVFIFEHPKEHGHFHSAQECKTYVRENPMPIINTLAKHYDKRPVERLLCVPEENVKRFVEKRDLKEFDT